MDSCLRSNTVCSVINMLMPWECLLLPLQAAGYFPAADQLSCVLCDPTSGVDSSFSNGFSMSATWLAASLSSAGACICSSSTTTSVVSTMQEYGRTFQRCLQCPTDSTPNSNSGSCDPAHGQQRTPAGDLTYVLSTLNAKGAGISVSTATQVWG